MTATAESSTPVASPATILPVDNMRECYGEGCNGAYPDDTTCDDVDTEVQESVPVVDENGNVLGTLSLNGSHEGCGSVQWASFDVLSEGTLTIKLWVVQEESGSTTQPVTWPNEDESATSTMFHSPVRAVGARVAVYNADGDLLGTGATNSR